MPDGQNKDTILNDLFWPFRQYSNVREWTSREPSAGVAMIVTGQILSSFGFSQGVTSAIGAIGVATLIALMLLRIITSSESPLEELSVRRRGVSTFLYIAAGFFYYVISSPVTLGNYSAVLVQFVLGLVIAFIAGAAHMRSSTLMKRADVKLRWRVIVATLVSIGTIVVLVTLVPVVLSRLGYTNVLELIREGSAKTNATVQKTVEKLYTG